MAERRSHERVALRLEARWVGLSGKHTASLIDLSAGGCYVESLAPVSVGEAIRLEVRLPTERWMALQGEVIYHHPNLGFGVRFNDLSELELEVLDSVMEFGGAG